MLKVGLHNNVELYVNNGKWTQNHGRPSMRPHRIIFHNFYLTLMQSLWRHSMAIFLKLFNTNFPHNIRHQLTHHWMDLQHCWTPTRNSDNWKDKSYTRYFTVGNRLQDANRQDGKCGFTPSYDDVRNVRNSCTMLRKQLMQKINMNFSSTSGNSHRRCQEDSFDCGIQMVNCWVLKTQQTPLNIGFFSFTMIPQSPHHHKLLHGHLRQRTWLSASNSLRPPRHWIPNLLHQSFGMKMLIYVQQFCMRLQLTGAARWTSTIWGQGTLCFLPKPHWKCHSPSDLRPISLLEPTGKAVMGALAASVQSTAWRKLCALPQFAYMKNRSCLDAITRILTHIDVVQHQMHMVQYKHHQAAVGSAQPGLWGGLIISLDLSQAFDQVPRHLLFQALEDFGISHDIRMLLQSIYSSTTFKFSHRGIQKEFKTTKGIRQGCKAAPCLWNIFLGKLLYELMELTSSDWVRQHHTIFADDWAIHEEIVSIQGFHRLITQLDTLLDLLHQFGMKINLEKTVALLRLTGTDAPKINRRYVLRSADGTFLRIPRKDGSFTHIRLVQSQTYLGITISYGAYQQQTLRYRQTCARNVASLLSKWLRGRGGLTSHQKAKLWLQCVFTSLIHGLSHVGLTPLQLQQLDGWCLTQLRHLFREPIHLNHISHTDFLLRFRLQDPLQILRKRLHGILTRELTRSRRLGPQDILHDADSHRPNTFLTTLETFIPCRRDKFDSFDINCFQCIYCNTSFLDVNHLRQHHSKCHGMREGQIRILDPLLDVLSGVPTCRRCGTHFTRWNTLKTHIEMTCLQDLPQEMPDVTSFRIAQTQFRQYINNNLENLENQAELIHRFLTRCSVCNQFHSSSFAMTKHWQTAHAVEYQMYTDTSQRLATMNPNQFREDGACVYCGRISKKKHYCVILRNLAMLAAHDELNEPAPTEYPTPAKMHTCEHCNWSFLTANGLKMHILKRHDAYTEEKFKIERDCIPNTTACAHCGKIFETMTAIERHIKMQKCTEFDPDLVANTLLHAKPTLQTFVDNNDCSGLLADQELLQILSYTCGLCQQEFKFRGNLIHHINTRHATLSQAVQTSTMELEELHRAPDRRCYCPENAGKRVHRTHKCVVFLQFELLRRYHQLTTPETTADDTPIDMPEMDRSTQLWDAETTDPNDDLSNDVLAQILRDNLVATSDSTPQPEAPLHGLHDPNLWPFNELPTISRKLSVGDLVMYTIHPHSVLTCPAELWWIGQGEYHKLWRTSAHLPHLCHCCLFCDVNFPDCKDVIPHVGTHWCEITGLTIDEFHICSKTFVEHFTRLAWFTDNDSNRAIVFQVFLVRLVADLFTDGCGTGHPHDGAVVEHPSERGDTQSLSTGRQTPCFPRSHRIKEEKRKTTSKSRSRSRQRCQSGAQDAHNSGFETRRQFAESSANSRVHLAFEGGTGKPDTNDDATEHHMAPDHTQNPEPETLPGGPDVSNLESSSGAHHESSTRRSIVSGQSEAKHCDGHTPVPILDLVRTIPKIDLEQRDGLAEGGAAADSHRSTDYEPGWKQHPEISCPEEGPGQPRLERGCNIPMALDGDHGNARPASALVLSQYLASRGCGSEETDSSKISSCKTVGISCEPKIIRVCTNRPGVFCWLNACSIGLCWLGIVCDSTGSDWKVGRWLFEELTQYSPMPLTIYHGGTAFHQMLCEWAESHSLKRQQDVADFLSFCLPALAPGFYSSKWMPSWAIMDDNNIAQDHDEKGSQFAPLLFSIDNATEDGSLQSLINHWHDATRHARTLLGCPAGTCIHLNRLRGTENAWKDQSNVFVSSHVLLPCHTAGCLAWIPFTVVAITYHLGSSLMSGHWKTILWQGDPWFRWMDYDDDKIPIVYSDIPQEVQQNWTIVWLASKPRFD